MICLLFAIIKRAATIFAEKFLLKIEILCHRTLDKMSFVTMQNNFNVLNVYLISSCLDNGFVKSDQFFHNSCTAFRCSNVCNSHPILQYKYNMKPQHQTNMLCCVIKSNYGIMRM